MKHLQVRRKVSVADPLQLERLLRALKIILEHQEKIDASCTLCPSHHLAVGFRWMLGAADADKALHKSYVPSELSQAVFQSST
jgi:hypothetical protein